MSIWLDQLVEHGKALLPSENFNLYRFAKHCMKGKDYKREAKLLFELPWFVTWDNDTKAKKANTREGLSKTMSEILDIAEKASLTDVTLGINTQQRKYIMSKLRYAKEEKQGTKTFTICDLPQSGWLVVHKDEHRVYPLLLAFIDEAITRSTNAAAAATKLETDAAAVRVTYPSLPSALTTKSVLLFKYAKDEEKVPTTTIVTDFNLGSHWRSVSSSTSKGCTSDRNLLATHVGVLNHTTVFKDFFVNAPNWTFTGNAAPVKIDKKRKAAVAVASTKKKKQKK